MGSPTSQPLVSIIIPTLNEEAHIAALLESLGQLAGVELIVADGDSCDATVEISSRYPVRVVRSLRGRGIQLNSGAEQARGEILLFLHADSRIEERVVDDIRSAIASGRLWGCCSLRFNESSLTFRIIAWFSNLRSRLLSSPLGDQAIFCQREWFWQNGGFSDMVFLEDLDFSRRLRHKQRAAVVDGRTITSTRRFRTTGVWRAVARNQVVKLGYLAGVKPERLFKWYASDQEGQRCRQR